MDKIKKNGMKLKMSALLSQQRLLFKDTSVKAVEILKFAQMKDVSEELNLIQSPNFFESK